MSRLGKATFLSYNRRCRRCDKFFSTKHRKATICPKCKKPIGGNMKGKK